MPKVKINNTQGLVQETGGGVALFGATQALTATSTTAADSKILATTSLCLVTSTNNARKVQLPATSGLDAGHTVIVATVGSHDVIIEKQAAGDRINGVNGALTIGESTGVKFIYSGTASPGWIAVVGDQATPPA